MALSDLVKSGVDLSNRDALEAATESDAALAASADTREHEVPEVVNPDPGEEEAAAEAEAAPAGDAPAATGEAAEQADLAPPEPTGEAAQPDPKDAEIAELKRQLAEASAAAAKNTEASVKSEAAQERATILAELVEELGENHPIVKETKRRHAAEDAAEQRDAVTAEATVTAEQKAAHATHIVTTPFLKSFYDNKDEEGIEIASAISNRIQADPKLAGTKAAEPFTAEHYREVEARLLQRFPETKARFYKVGKPAVRETGKVVSLSQVRGGSSPGVTGKAGEDATRDTVFSKVLSADPNTSLDTILANLG